MSINHSRDHTSSWAQLAKYSQIAVAGMFQICRIWCTFQKHPREWWSFENMNMNTTDMEAPHQDKQSIILSE